MYKYILESAGDINWMAMFALITFVIVFAVAIIQVLRRNSKHIRYMSELPLLDDQENNN